MSKRQGTSQQQRHLRLQRKGTSASHLGSMPSTNSSDPRRLCNHDRGRSSFAIHSAEREGNTTRKAVDYASIPNAVQCLSDTCT